MNYVAQILFGMTFLICILGITSFSLLIFTGTIWRLRVPVRSSCSFFCLLRTLVFALDEASMLTFCQVESLLAYTYKFHGYLFLFVLPPTLPWVFFSFLLSLVPSVSRSNSLRCQADLLLFLYHMSRICDYWLRVRTIFLPGLCLVAHDVWLTFHFEYTKVES